MVGFAWKGEPVTPPNIIRQDEINVIFVRSELDDARLTAYEFRVYAHIARRSNCYASLESMADICQMSQAQIKRVMTSLKQKGMIDVISRPGSTNLISITPPRAWSEDTWRQIEVSRKALAGGVRKEAPSSVGATHPALPELPPSSVGATKDIPIRESQLREETVAAEAAPLPSETSFPKSKAPVPHPKNSASPPPTPKAKAPRPRDPLFDAMMGVCFGVSESSRLTKEQSSWIGKAVSQVKGIQPNLTPEMIRQFAVNKRKHWAECPINPATYMKCWEYIEIPEVETGGQPDPWGGKATVTMWELSEKFPSGVEQRKWMERLRAQRRLK